MIGTFSTFAEDKIEVVPLINLEELSPTFEEDKDELESVEDKNIIILDAYTIKNTDSILALADGIILTGGEDINPLQYNDTINLAVCGDINYQRDTQRSCTSL